jgi:hypothetical protein
MTAGTNTYHKRFVKMLPETVSDYLTTTNNCFKHRTNKMLRYYLEVGAEYGVGKIYRRGSFRSCQVGDRFRVKFVNN